MLPPDPATAGLPLVAHLRPAPDAVAAFLRWQSRPHCLFLDSALRRPRLARWSFLAADPFDFLRMGVDGSDALRALEQRCAPFVTTSPPRVAPFQGGAAGLFAYDLLHSLERVPYPRYDEFHAPALAVGLYDVVLAIDHELGEAWLFSHGFPAGTADARRARAAQRLEEFQRLLDGPAPALARRPAYSLLPRQALAPQFAVRDFAGVTSNFRPEDYRQAVRRTVEYIRAGDAFQVNLAQRLVHPAVLDPVTLYLRLRECNAATFAGFFDLGDFQILSASPERFLQVQDRTVEARPIKGTRERLPHVEASLYAAEELRLSEKDRAENVMIVDLLRNDLSRVCEADSVRVSELCRLESYEFVQHLVSAVRGRLQADVSPLDLLRAAFPGGSITGAPKVRAMEIIAELEPTARGPYCGSLGYVGFDGSLDLSILIRTITAGRGWWQMPVGGGITAQSDPQREYEETWHKALGLLGALPAAC